jgi:protein TonB
MMRIAEAALFLSLAAAAHAGVWVLAPEAPAAQSAGDAGQDTVTLSAANAAQMAMLERWTKAPVVTAVLTQSTSTATPVLMPPPLPKSAPTSSTHQLRPVALEKPPQDAVPFADTQTAQPPAPTNTPTTRPKMRPELSQKTALQASDTQPEKRASGAGSSAQKGIAGRNLTGTDETRRYNALKVAWGAKIQAKIKRNFRYPRGATSSGTTQLDLRVAKSGRLETVNVLRSSGDARLDAAALRAVQKAGRFAKAPSELEDKAHAFSMSFTFDL